MSRTITITLEENTKLPRGVLAISAALPPMGTEDERYIIATDIVGTTDQTTAGYLLECLRIYHRDHDNPFGLETMNRVRANELSRLYPLLCEMLKEEAEVGADPAEI